MGRLFVRAPTLCGILAGIALAAAIGLSFDGARAYAQAVAQAVAPAPPTTAPAAPPASVAKPTAPKAPVVKNGITRPLWTELTSTQQQALKPLAATWNTISEPQKRKWLALSQNYATLPPAEQARLHERAAEWVALSHQERSQARLNFAQTKELTAAEKQAKWEAYQALSSDEKKKLAESASTRLPGAATAVKPVPRQKLTALPEPSKNVKPTPKIAAAPYQVEVAQPPPPPQTAPAPSSDPAQAQQ